MSNNEYWAGRQPIVRRVYERLCTGTELAEI